VCCGSVIAVRVVSSVGRFLQRRKLADVTAHVMPSEFWFPVMRSCALLLFLLRGDLGLRCPSCRAFV
jgi:hypothetical protein